MYKTNDADLSSFSLVQFVVRMSPLYGAFNRLIGPGGGKISHLLTLGNVPGLGGPWFQLTDALK